MPHDRHTLLDPVHPVRYLGKIVSPDRLLARIKRCMVAAGQLELSTRQRLQQPIAIPVIRAKWWRHDVRGRMWPASVENLRTVDTAKGRGDRFAENCGA